MASIDPTEFIDVDLSEVLQSCTDLFGSDDVEFTPSADSMPVRGSRAHLMRVFNNLLSNAVYAVRESERADGLIQVKVNRSGQGWTVEVSDNGIGIDSSRIERIFEPRFTTKSSGSGLGLSMARFMVNHFGGSISVESEFGQGTTFSVWLPQSLE
jgi:signal transduction histidine kinase